MDLNKPKARMTESEKVKLIENLNRAKVYGRPRKAWAEDGHLLIEGHDGDLISMMPEVAIYMGQMLSEIGTDALINKVIDDGE